MKERTLHLDIDVTEEILCKLREAQCFATKIIQKNDWKSKYNV